MNRTIKFRGWFQQFDGREFWVYGFFYTESETGNSYIHNGVEVYCVDEESVGAFTGLKDKNGIDIYEGDIVSFDDYGTKQADVIWLNRASAFVLNTTSYGKSHTKLRGRGKLEVIGNIYQNPELV